MNDYLTIKEVAELTNSSYQNIYQRARTTLNKYLIEINGKKMLKKAVLGEFNISSDGESFKEDFKSGNKADLNDKINDNLNDDGAPLHQSNNNEAELKELIRQLQADLKRKDEIIIEKDKQLKEQTDEIIALSNRVATLFENSQKLQLQTSFLLSESSDTEQADLYGARPIDDVKEDKPKRKGLFSRLFK